MKVLELFCGHGGWSKPWIEAGHTVTGIDLNDFSKEYPGKFIQTDIFDWKPKEHYDIILASPPCTEFSIAKKFAWGTQDERQGLDLIWRCYYLIDLIKPKYFVIENVKGLNEFLANRRENIPYGRHCNIKSASLWGNYPTMGFFETSINHITADELIKTCSIKEKSAKLGIIPYALAKAMQQAMTKESEVIT